MVIRSRSVGSVHGLTSEPNSHALTANSTLLHSRPESIIYDTDSKQNITSSQSENPVYDTDIQQNSTSFPPQVHHI